MFSPEFRKRLRLGKYSRWAVKLTEDQLEAIIWIVGECGYRAYDVLPLLKELWSEEGSGRAVLALESLYRVVGGDRPDLDDWRHRVQRFLAEVRKYADEVGGPPARSWSVEWQGRVVGWIAFPELGEYGCSIAGVWHPATTEAVEFLLVVAQPPPDGVRVELGGIPAWVKSAPDESGRMEFYVHVSPNAYELIAQPNAEPLSGTRDLSD